MLFENKPNVRAAFERFRNAERPLLEASDLFRRGAEGVIHNFGVFERSSAGEITDHREGARSESNVVEACPREAEVLREKVAPRRQQLP